MMAVILTNILLSAVPPPGWNPVDGPGRSCLSSLQFHYNYSLGAFHPSFISTIVHHFTNLIMQQMKRLESPENHQPALQQQRRNQQEQKSRITEKFEKLLRRTSENVRIGICCERVRGREITPPQGAGSGASPALCLLL